MATRAELFGVFAVMIGGSCREGLARGEKVDRARHAAEIKGATLTELNFEEQQPG
jgi:hypothetical protein